MCSVTCTCSTTRRASTLEGPHAFAAFWDSLSSSLTAGRSMADYTRVWLRGCGGPELLQRWHEFSRQVADEYAGLDPAQRVKWAGPDMSVRSCISARQMETWAHGQAAFDLLGRVRVEHDRIRNIAIMGVNTFGWTFANRGRAVPSVKPHVRLQSPSGEWWTWNEPGRAQSRRRLGGGVLPGRRADAQHRRHRAARERRSGARMDVDGAVLRRTAGNTAAARAAGSCSPVMTHANTPVIVGVGQYTDRLDSPQYRGLSSVELAVEAASRACRDALDDPRLVAQIDGIGALRTFEDSIPRYSTPFGKSDNFPHSIARRLGATPRTAVWASVGGDTPQTLVSEFCERIASGSLHVALVVGSEAISTSKHLMANNLAADWAESIDAPVDDRGLGLEELSTPYTRQHGLVAGVDFRTQCSSTRAARGWDVATGLCARDGPPVRAVQRGRGGESVFDCPGRVHAGALVAVTERNRMIADPYTRLLVARDQVNQAAAVLIASAGAAQELGIDPASGSTCTGIRK